MAKVVIELDPVDAHNLQAILHQYKPRKKLYRSVLPDMRERFHDSYSHGSKTEMIAAAVIQDIVEVSRLRGIDPRRIDPEKALMDRFIINSMMYTRLAGLLTDIVETYSRRGRGFIDREELKNLKTIADCIELVLKRIATA